MKKSHLIISLIAVIASVAISGVIVVSAMQARQDKMDHSLHRDDPASAEAIRDGLMNHH